MAKNSPQLHVFPAADAVLGALADFFVAEASNLSLFKNASFDAVVMAFNALDYVLPDDKRRQCLRECQRVLRTGGVLIFSSHNPRPADAVPSESRNKTADTSLYLVRSKRDQPFGSICRA